MNEVKARTSALSALVVWLPFLPSLLPAATIVPPLDLGELALRSDAVVLARARGSVVSERGSLLFTRTDLQVERVLSGPAAPGDILLVETPGGELEGKVWFVSGSPRFAAGERYLLGLHARAEDLWIPALLAYGILHETADGGVSRLAPLPEAADVAALPRPDGAEPEAVTAYETEALLEHLGAVLDRRLDWEPSAARPSALEPPAGGGGAVPAVCALLTDQGRGVRWRVFDTHGSATMFADATGDSSISGGGFRIVQDAMDLWMAISGTGVNLRYGGPVDLAIDCGQGAQPNTIVFNDPCSDMQDLQGCSGVLAFGGPLANGPTHSFDARTWLTAEGWIVVVNNGSGCLGESNYRIMLGHEMGHGLGFGHVSDSRAMMFASCCNAPNATDSTCVRYLYPASDRNNLRPVVDAGENRALALAGNSIRLSGTATDDGLPANPGKLTVGWRQVGGPGRASFADAPLLETRVAFSRSGTYLLALTADDGELERSDVVEVAVSIWAGSRTVATFRQGERGYTGTADTFILESAPAADNSRAAELSVDGDEPRGSGLRTQALLRFDDIFGPGSTQVPPGAAVVAATLALSATNLGDGAALHRMDDPWSATDTWASLGADGVQPGAEAERLADASTEGSAAARIDVTRTLSIWSVDPCLNQGWVFIPTGADGWDFYASEGAEPPALTVEYSAAEAERLIQVGDRWRYFKGRTDPSPLWKEPEFVPDASWLEGATGIGYGDGDDGTVLGDMQNGYGAVYCRRTFQVSDAASVSRLILGIDYDDGFIAYLNGEEVARSASLGPPGRAVSRTDFASPREAGEAEVFAIDAGLLHEGENVLAVAVHNESLGSSDLSLLPQLTAGRFLVDDGDEWRLLKGSAPVPAAWNTVDFDDTAWPEAPTGIGYGDGDDATELPDMRDSYAAIFARRSFDLPGLGGVDEALLAVIHDDGAVAHLNGVEVGRANMPAGPATAATLGSSSIEAQVTVFRLPSSRLRPGKNVLAVSIHNASLDSSDLSFSALLLPVRLAPKTVDCTSGFQRGDSSGDGSVNITDAIVTLGHLFRGGPAPPCLDAADADDSGKLTLTDAVVVLAHLFQGGPETPLPGVSCGRDPTVDPLGDCSTAVCDS